MIDLETKKLDLEILSVLSNSRSILADKAFETLAFKIFKYQYERNPNYRKYCLLEGKKPGALKSWKDIPAMPALGFKELVLATFPIKNAVKVFKTSGTTGREVSTPACRPGRDDSLRGAHFFDSLKLYETAILPPFKKYLIPAASAIKTSVDLQTDPQDFLFCFLISSPEEAPSSSLSHMMGVVNRVFALKKGKYYVVDGKIKQGTLVRDLKQSKKKAFILATAFSLKSFLNYLRANKIFLKLPNGSRLMETGGFKGKIKAVSKDTLYVECEKRLGINKDHCVSEYGMTELSSQFYDTTLWDKVMGIQRKSFKAGPMWVRTLIIDPKTGKETKKGQVGILRHFDLANRGSVIAIQTEDLGRQVGNGFELLGRAAASELRGCSLSYEEFLRS